MAATGEGLAVTGATGPTGVPAPEELRLLLLADAGSVNTQRFCEGLAGAGVDVRVASFRGEVASARGNHRLRAPARCGKAAYALAAPQARAAVRACRPGLLASYYVTGYGLLGTLTGFRPRVQITAGSDVLIAPGSWLLRRVVAWNLSTADLVVAWAPHVAEAAVRAGADARRVLVLPRGIPVDEFAAHRARRPSEQAGARVISTRSLWPQYNLTSVLRAMALLPALGLADWALTIAGEGPERGDLQALASSLGVADRVTFAGLVPNQELPRLLAEHDLYLSASASDGVSASLLEAMAVGLFPVVVDNAANRHWLGAGEGGTLVGEASPGEIAAAIARSHRDPTLRKAAVERNRVVVRDRGDRARNARLLAQRFESLLGRAGQ